MLEFKEQNITFSDIHARMSPELRDLLVDCLSNSLDLLNSLSPQASSSLQQGPAAHSKPAKPIHSQILQHQHFSPEKPDPASLLSSSSFMLKDGLQPQGKIIESGGQSRQRYPEEVHLQAVSPQPAQQSPLHTESRTLPLNFQPASLHPDRISPRVLSSSEQRTVVPPSETPKREVKAQPAFQKEASVNHPQYAHQQTTLRPASAFVNVPQGPTTAPPANLKVTYEPAPRPLSQASLPTTHLEVVALKPIEIRPQTRVVRQQPAAPAFHLQPSPPQPVQVRQQLAPAQAEPPVSYTVHDASEVQVGRPYIFDKQGRKIFIDPTNLAAFRDIACTEIPAHIRNKPASFEQPRTAAPHRPVPVASEAPVKVEVIRQQPEFIAGIRNEDTGRVLAQPRRVKRIDIHGNEHFDDLAPSLLRQSDVKQQYDWDSEALSAQQFRAKSTSKNVALPRRANYPPQTFATRLPPPEDFELLDSHSRYERPNYDPQPEASYSKVPGIIKRGEQSSRREKSVHNAIQPQTHDYDGRLLRREPEGRRYHHKPVPIEYDRVDPGTSLRHRQPQAAPREQAVWETKQFTASNDSSRSGARRIIQ